MRASVKVSPTTCSFRPPVQGDKELPNHEVTVEGKILKETPKSIRGAAFIEVTVRAGGGNTGYSLRVFPERKRFEFTRGPEGGGFPTDGKSDAIKGINERNALRIAATGAKITASVNGKEVAAVEDGNPGQVAGTKVRFAIGSNEQEAQGHHRHVQAGRGRRSRSVGRRARFRRGLMTTETIERPRSAGPGSGSGGDWKVIVLNDDHNTFDHVAHTLAAVIPGITTRDRLSAGGADPQKRPRDRLVRPEGARRALLGAARRCRADAGSAREQLAE